VGKEKIYEKISFGYSTSLQNRISFKMRDLQDYKMVDGDFVYKTNKAGVQYREKEFGDSLGVKALQRLNNGMSHNFQIGLPNFTLFKYINVTPSISYGMNWMFNKGRQYLETELDEKGNPILVTDKEGNQVMAQKMVSDPGTAFNGFGATHTYSGSVSASTRIYGMFNFGKHRKIQAIRHVITPSMSLSFSPEKGTSFNGWRTLEAYYDKRGTYHAESQYNIYSVTGHHNSVSPPGRGKSATMSLSFGNNLEAKVRDLKDTTGTGSKKVKLLDQLNINTSYNFLADSLRMQNVGISASTNLFNKVNISGNLNFDPYAIDDLKDDCGAPKKPIYYADIILKPFEKRSKSVYTEARIVPREDNQGELKVWSAPNNHIFKVKNRYLVSVDIGGASDKADYTVMTVIDQMGLCKEVKGRPRVVARWRGHVRHDILAWKAAALAHYYDDALLIIESNTADREKDTNTEGDHFGTIINEISKYYPNLYQRNKTPESVSEGIEPIYGFQTNVKTKQWIIDNLIACVDDKLWEEPDEQMYAELGWYERDPDTGKMGNQPGSNRHDDVLMSTAIGLYVAYNNDIYRPSWRNEAPKEKKPRIHTEAEI
jgi:hypothetical protein